MTLGLLLISLDTKKMLCEDRCVEGQSEEEKIDAKIQSSTVRGNGRKKPKVRFSTRKEIEPSRMRQLKTKSRGKEDEKIIPTTINFEGLGIEELSIDIRTIGGALLINGRRTSENPSLDIVAK